MGIFDNFNNRFGQFGMPANLGLLTTGIGLLDGQNPLQAIQAGIGTYGSFQEMEEDRRRKAALTKLLSDGGFTDQEKGIISASNNPASVAAQIRNDKLAFQRQQSQPLSNIAKLRSDLDNKLITQQEYDDRLKVMNYLKPVGSTAVSPIGKLSEDLKAGKITQDEYDAAFKKATQLSNTQTPDDNFLNAKLAGYTDEEAAITRIDPNYIPKRLLNPEGTGFRIANAAELAAFREAGGFDANSELGGVLYINREDMSPKFIKTGSSKTEINVDTGNQTDAFAEKFAEIRAKNIAETQDITDELEAISTFNALESLVSDEDFYSGTAGELVLQAKQALVSIGLADENMVASSEAFRAQTRKAALDGIGGSLGVGFSNADRDFIVEQNPSLSNTPQGNKALIRLNRNIQQRRVDTAIEINKYLAENNYDESGLNRHMLEWAEGQPSISKGIFENELNIPPGDVIYPKDGNFSGFTKPMLDSIDISKLTEEEKKNLLSAYKQLLN